MRLEQAIKSHKRCVIKLTKCKILAGVGEAIHSDNATGKESKTLLIGVEQCVALFTATSISM